MKTLFFRGTLIVGEETNLPPSVGTIMQTAHSKVSPSWAHGRNETALGVFSFLEMWARRIRFSLACKLQLVRRQCSPA